MPSYTATDNFDADKLPSVKQWMRTVSKEALEPVRIVKLIWLPNLFDNYSLDTEAFRLRVAPSQQLFQILEDNLDEWLETGAVLGLQIEGSKRPKITLLTLDGEECEWDALGEHGFKMSNLAARKKPKGKTRASQTASTAVPTASEAQEAASE